MRKKATYFLGFALLLVAVGAFACLSEPSRDTGGGSVTIDDVLELTLPAGWIAYADEQQPAVGAKFTMMNADYGAVVNADVTFTKNLPIPESTVELHDQMVAAGWRVKAQYDADYQPPGPATFKYENDLGAAGRAWIGRVPGHEQYSVKFFGVWGAASDEAAAKDFRAIVKTLKAHHVEKEKK